MEDEAIRVRGADLEDLFVGREPAVCLEPAREVVGGHEVRENGLQLIVAVVMEALHGGVADRRFIRSTWPSLGTTIPRGLLKKALQSVTEVDLATRLPMIEMSISIIPAASFLRFMAAAVSRAWIFIFSIPLRMALASSWSIFAVPCAPSTRHRWRASISYSSLPQAARLRRARGIAAWFAMICTRRDGVPLGKHCALRGQRAQSCRSA